MSEPRIYYSTEPICEQCRRPRYTPLDLARWADENPDHSVVVNEPLWARRVCWASEGACMVDVTRAALRIADAEYQATVDGEIEIRSTVEHAGVHEHGTPPKR